MPKARPRTVASQRQDQQGHRYAADHPASGRRPPTAGKTAPAPEPRCLPLDADQPGSASPLRVMLCIAAPASPSMAPHSSAIRIRGRRISNRIKRGCSPISCGASRPAPRRRGQRIAAAAKAVQPQRQQRQHYAGGILTPPGAAAGGRRASGRNRPGERRASFKTSRR